MNRRAKILAKRNKRKQALVQARNEVESLEKAAELGRQRAKRAIAWIKEYGHTNLPKDF